MLTLYLLLYDTWRLLLQDGTYALEVGELSPVIVSDSGVHVILRTG